MVLDNNLDNIALEIWLEVDIPSTMKMIGVKYLLL